MIAFILIPLLVVIATASGLAHLCFLLRCRRAARRNGIVYW